MLHSFTLTGGGGIRITLKMPQTIKTEVGSSDGFIIILFAAPEETRVVGIVGIGHMPGISRLFGTINDADIPPIMT